MVRVFRSRIDSYKGLKKWSLMVPCTQHYKVRIKGKVEQSRERSSALPNTLGSPSTTVANFTIYKHKCVGIFTRLSRVRQKLNFQEEFHRFKLSPTYSSVNP